MPTIRDLDWDHLAREHGPCADRLYRALATGGRSFRAADYARKTSCPETDVEALLEEVAASGVLLPEPVWLCRARRCVLDDPEGDACPECDAPYGEHGRPERTVQYRAAAPPRRSVPALLMVHGMNTKGEWQEEIARFVTGLHGRAIPIAIYKYGWIVTGVIMRWRQRALTRRLITQIRLVSSELGDRPFGSRPDVIAHSFGTWLLHNALETDPDLRLGHIVLTGCVVPPDARWEEFGDRIGPVLNHYGGKDFPTRIAAYVIPDAGPSGRRGFNRQPGVVQVHEPGYRHSGCFDRRHRDHVFKDVWKPFLTCPAEDLSNLDPETFAPTHPPDAPDWKRVPAFFRAGVVRWLALALLLLAAPFAVGLALEAGSVALVLAVGLAPVFLAVFGLGRLLGWDS